MSPNFLGDSLNKISCVFVDFDGTLVDSIGSLYESYCQLLGLYGYVGNRDEFDSLNGPSTCEIVETLISKYNLADSAKAIHSRYLEFIRSNYSNSKPFTNAELFLSKTRDWGMKLVLVTSCPSEVCLVLIKRFGWERYFSDFVWGESVKASKPDPAIYLEALRRSELSKDKIVVIEDSVNGVRSAHGAGLTVLGVNSSFRFDELIEAGATLVFSDLSEIIESGFFENEV